MVLSEERWMDGLQLVALLGCDASVPDRGSVLSCRPHESGVELKQVPGLHWSELVLTGDIESTNLMRPDVIV